MTGIITPTHNAYDYGDLGHEDGQRINAAQATPADFQRLREKFAGRVQLVNTVNRYDPEHPLHAEHRVRFQEYLNALHAGDTVTQQAYLDWECTMYGKEE